MTSAATPPAGSSVRVMAMYWESLRTGRMESVPGSPRLLRSPPRALLLLLTVLLLGAEHFPAVQSFTIMEKLDSLPTSVATEPTFTHSQSTMKIVGSSNMPVHVYVKLNHNTPHILCLTEHLRDVELQDPLYQWHGPLGQSLPDSTNVVVTATGTLLIRNFKEEMSGMYRCTLHYSPSEKKNEKKYFLEYIISAYIEPNFNYEFSVRYHSAPCESPLNTAFQKKMLELLKKLVQDLTCEVILLRGECHQVKMQRAGLQNELFFLFSVFSLDSPEDVICLTNCSPMDRLNKAKELIKTFFEKQTEKLEEGRKMPEIYFIEGTLNIVWVDRCFPGYGMDPLLHPGCLNCCVICGPGTYNPQDGIHCLHCNSTKSYGTKTC